MDSHFRGNDIVRENTFGGMLITGIVRRASAYYHFEMSDRGILYLSSFLRALAIGMVGVLLGIYLAKLTFTPAQIGLVITLGLAGAAFAALLITFWGDRFGRKKTLVLLALCCGVGSLIVAASNNALIIYVTAFIGMLNGMGKDRGAMLVVEQTIIPATVTDKERTRAFAWYNVLQDIGYACGGLLAALPTLVSRHTAIAETDALRIAVAMYGGCYLIAAIIYLRLSSHAEIQIRPEKLKLSPTSKKTLWKISLLFALDSIAGGFLGSALLSYFFFDRFDVAPTVIAVLFFFGRLAGALSHLGAAWLAKHIGLVNTMVFTHIPSSLLLVTVGLVSDFWVAALLFLIRECFVEMDVPTRQSYLMAVMQPGERTFASGVTSLVRVGGWAVAPVFAGFFMQSVALATPLFIGAAMKISYDLMLWRAFRKIKPPEEL